MTVGLLTVVGVTLGLAGSWVADLSTPATGTSIPVVAGLLGGGVPAFRPAGPSPRAKDPGTPLPTPVHAPVAVPPAATALPPPSADIDIPFMPAATPTAHAPAATTALTVAPKPRPPEPPISARELHGRVSPSVVALVVSNGSAPAAVVPGVMVTASGLIITSGTAIRDAVDGAASLAMVKANGGGRLAARALADAVPARLLAVADELDLALVEAMPAQSVFYPHLPIARRAPEAGGAAWIVGHERKRGLWSGSMSALGSALGKVGVARWRRAVTGDLASLSPGAPLVDGVGRIVGMVVAAPGGGSPVAVDQEGLLRFLLAANAPALRFAGIPPMRRPLPGATAAARTPGQRNAPAGSMTGFVAAADSGPAIGMPTVNRKGMLDRRFPSPPGVGTTGEAPAAPTTEDRTAGGARRPSQVSFASGGAVPHLALGDLERNGVPGSVPVDVGDAPLRGARGAALTIVELGDYHGPETRDAEPTVRELVEGAAAPARLFWKDADRGDGATYHLPARAARAAGEQDAFWSMHDRLMRLPPDVSAEKVRKLARALDLDERAFLASLASDGLLTAIEGDAQRAGKLPVLCTPAFFVNGQAVDGGSIAGAALRAAVDDELTARATGSAPPRPCRAIAPAAPIGGAAFEPARMARVIADAARKRAAGR